MFDDNVGGGAEPPKNLPIAEPDDIFSKVDSGNATDISMAEKLESDSALDNGLLKKKVAEDVAVGATSLPRVNTIPQTEIYETKEPVLGKIFIILLVAAAALGLGYGAWRFYVDYTEETAETLKVDEVQMTTQPEVMEEEITEPEETVVPEEEILPEEKLADESVLDDDKDSLNNALEKELGTDPFLADTDKDELRDGDEVSIWQTDPLNADTDGDGFKDGEEIKNGYNPMGSGKLFNNTTSTASEDQTVNI